MSFTENNSSGDIIFSYPHLFDNASLIPGINKPSGLKPALMQVSITGNQCLLQCNHCQGNLLKAMPHGKTPDDLWSLSKAHSLNGGSHILITGGSDLQGRLPFRAFADTFRRIRQELGLEILVHAGLANDEDARILSACDISLAMTDIYGNAETASRVMNLDIKSDSFLNTIKTLMNYHIPVSPHLITGMGHEEDALAQLHGLPLKSLVFLSLRNIVRNKSNPVTDPEACSPDRIASLIRLARSELGNITLCMGCMKAHGKLRDHTEIAAIRAGMDVISTPGISAWKYAEKSGLNIYISQLCCALSRFARVERFRPDSLEL